MAGDGSGCLDEAVGEGTSVRHAGSRPVGTSCQPDVQGAMGPGAEVHPPPPTAALADTRPSPGEALQSPAGRGLILPLPGPGFRWEGHQRVGGWGIGPACSSLA